ncbi:MAG: peptide-methionine (S)-S-oxide reductase MsrA [Hymenobacteraceae bacterium]|nr:peptide-methionine (S)-S-oxide reductase MsrA [Hymenobacteraceae bacterium]
MNTRLVSFGLGLVALLTFAYARTSPPQDSGAHSTAAPAPTNLKGLAVATFAGGCFWAQEEVFEEVRGVRAAISGYTGGTVANPSYEQVASRQTGHAEAVQVYYDPQTVSYATLLDVFLRASHNPTQLNRQGPDVGDEYRSAVFYRTPEEKIAIEAAITRVNTARLYPDPVVTQVVALTTFYPAEDYHQGYYRLHPEQGYIATVSRKKVEHFRHEFPHLVKAGTEK